MMALETEGPIDLFLALVLGTVLGHSLHLQARIDALTQRASRGFMEAFMLFCLGSMTLVGCMEDGLLGKPNLLFIKGTMDLISSAFLAATLGRGVLWSAAGVLGFQGALTLAFMALGEGMDPALIRELSALGASSCLASRSSCGTCAPTAVRLGRWSTRCLPCCCSP